MREYTRAFFVMQVHQFVDGFTSLFDRDLKMSFRFINDVFFYLTQYVCFSCNHSIRSVCKEGAHYE